MHDGESPDSDIIEIMMPTTRNTAVTVQKHTVATAITGVIKRSGMFRFVQRLKQTTAARPQTAATSSGATNVTALMPIRIEAGVLKRGLFLRLHSKLCPLKSNSQHPSLRVQLPSDSTKQVLHTHFPSLQCITLSETFPVKPAMFG